MRKIIRQTHHAILLATRGTGWHRPLLIAIWWLTIGWKIPFVTTKDELLEEAERDQRRFWKGIKPDEEQPP